MKRYLIAGLALCVLALAGCTTTDIVTEQTSYFGLQGSITPTGYPIATLGGGTNHSTIVPYSKTRDGAHPILVPGICGMLEAASVYNSANGSATNNTATTGASLTVNLGNTQATGGAADILALAAYATAATPAHNPMLDFKDCSKAAMPLAVASTVAP
jgi:hypothetical protein